MDTKRILVVDDDRAMRRALLMSLVKQGYDVRPAETAEKAFGLLPEWHPHLVLLDIGLPDMDGLEALRQLRHTTSVPVIFVTSRRRELDEVIGLEMGADDYITKPFHLDVLLARVKTTLRRTASSSAEPVKKALAVGDLRMDPRTFHAAVDERTLDLTPKEFDLLFYLAGRATEVVTVDEIVTHVWGEGWIGETQTVYVHMRWLRTKLETDPAHPERLLTVRGLGYKLMPHAQAVPT